MGKWNLFVDSYFVLEKLEFLEGVELRIIVGGGVVFLSVQVGNIILYKVFLIGI